MTRDQFAETLRVCLVAQAAKPLISDLADAIKANDTSKQNKIADALAETLADLVRTSVQRRTR